MFQSEEKLKRQRSIEPTFIGHLRSPDKPLSHLETVAEEVAVAAGQLDPAGEPVSSGQVQVSPGHDEVDNVSLQFAQMELAKQIIVETDLAEKQMAEYEDDISKAKFPKKPGAVQFNKSLTPPQCKK